MIKAPWFNKDPAEWLTQVLKVHFDREGGTPYWLKKQRELSISVPDEIKCVGDLKLLGPTADEDLAEVPLEDFLPKRFLGRRRSFVIGETGGTTGRIKTTVYLGSEFRKNFVDFLKHVFLKGGFPKRLNWLYVGPSGPHVMFKNAQALARALSSMEPFCVDFEARWIKKMERGSAGFERYKDHVLGQAERIFRIQEIGVLFTAPVIALALAEELPRPKTEKIKGVHLGGMALTRQAYRKVAETYPSALIIPGYGNTLFGVTLELSRSDDYSVSYYPPGPRVIIKIVPKNGARDAERISQEVALGESIKVVPQECCSPSPAIIASEHRRKT